MSRKECILRDNWRLKSRIMRQEANKMRSVLRIKGQGVCMVRTTGSQKRYCKGVDVTRRGSMPDLLKEVEK